MVIMSLEGSPPPALIWVHRVCVCAWSLKYDWGVALNSVRGRVLGAERQVGYCRFLGRVGALILGLAVWLLIRHLCTNKARW